MINLAYYQMWEVKFFVNLAKMQKNQNTSNN